MGGLPPDVCCADGPYCRHRYPDIDERDERDEPADQARDDARAIARAILPDFLDPNRQCTLKAGQDYRVRRDVTTRLHGASVTLRVGRHVRVRRVTHDLAMLEDRRGTLLAITITGDLDPHGWADVFGETTR